jgi:hypothetical protein
MKHYLLMAVLIVVIWAISMWALLELITRRLLPTGE